MPCQGEPCILCYLVSIFKANTTKLMALIAYVISSDLHYFIA